MATVLQPPGWAAPRGYANGVSVSGRQVFVAGQIGWNAQSQFESDDLVARGIAAGPLVQHAVTEIDGRGGGRPQMAQGKGTRREGLEDAIAAVRAAVADRAAGG